MRICAKIALIAILLPGVVGSAVAEEKHRAFVPGTKITLKARQAKYFLGENILLDYQIEYSGDGALAVDTATGLGSTDCTVLALDANGKKAAASTRAFHCTGQSGGLLRQGDSISFTIPLSYYCRLEKPGKYRIRAAHNLYWTDPNVAIAEDDRRWAETTIEVVMPDEAQARKVVENMLGAKEDVKRYQAGYTTWNTGDYADFACLRYPVYLPILEKMVSDEAADKREQLRIRADSRALFGIAHNPAPEATQALLHLLKTTDPERRKAVVAALCDRLPEPKGIRRPNRCNSLRAEDADPQLVNRSWRAEFDGPMRAYARNALADTDPELVWCAAFALEAIGVENDLPDLVAAVSRLVPIVERTEPPHYIGEIAPVRLACREVACAVAAFAARGVEPKADPQTPGEIVHFVLAVKHQKDFRPKGWEKRCRDWIRTQTPYVREFVLFNTPRPMPEALLDSYREGTRKVLATTREQTTIHSAVRSALEFEIPVDELLGALVDRMDSEVYQLYVHIHSCLRSLLETGKHESAFASCTPPLDKKQMAAFKDRWKQFLKDHGRAVRNGKRFDGENPVYRWLMYGEMEDER
jgi:hypothetical protein